MYLPLVFFEIYVYIFIDNMTIFVMYFLLLLLTFFDFLGKIKMHIKEL